MLQAHKISFRSLQIWSGIPPYDLPLFHVIFIIYSDISGKEPAKKCILQICEKFSWLWDGDKRPTVADNTEKINFCDFRGFLYFSLLKSD